MWSRSGWRLNEQYRSGERAWVKTKNRDYWRYEIEREGPFATRTTRHGLGDRAAARLQERQSRCSITAV